MPLQPSQKDMKMLEVLYNTNKYNELEIATKKLIQKYPNIAPLLNILGFALHKQGHLKKAVISYEQAIVSSPKFVFAHNNLGNVFTAGVTATSDNTDDLDYVILKYNANGELQWNKIINGKGNKADIPTALTTDLQNNVIITGVSSGTDTDADYLTLKLDKSDGDKLWGKRYDCWVI